MRVKIKDRFETNTHLYLGGEVVEIPDALAAEWIKAGLAEREKAKPETPEQATTGSDDEPVVHARRTRRTKEAG